jgi:cathepsin B
LDLLEDLGYRRGGASTSPNKVANPTADQLSLTTSLQNAPLNTEYTTSYQQDKHFGTNQYSIAEDVQEIQTEILTKGPVEAQYEYIVYGGFYSYRGIYFDNGDSSLSTSFIPGVYQHVMGTYAGRHAVKILGWGTEDGTPYWLVANSWGAQ